MALRVLLDSTYLLPTFGIGVEGISDEDIKLLRDLSPAKVKYYCLSVVWIEILGKVYKEASKKKVSLDTIIDVAVESLIRSGLYSWIDPTPEAIKIAYKLRTIGHKDMIDNLLYGTAISEKMIFLTMDTTFINFLRKNGYNTNNILNHKELIHNMHL